MKYQIERGKKEVAGRVGQEKRELTEINDEKDKRIR